MLPEASQKQGVATASAGNHALALSYHGQELGKQNCFNSISIWHAWPDEEFSGKMTGIPVTVVMPIVAPIMKVQSCRQFGANIIIHVITNSTTTHFSWSQDNFWVIRVVILASHASLPCAWPRKRDWRTLMVTTTRTLSPAKGLWDWKSSNRWDNHLHSYVVYTDSTFPYVGEERWRCRSTCGRRRAHCRSRLGRQIPLPSHSR